MGRPRNADESEELRVAVLPVLKAWLEQLAKFGVYGKNPTAVAEHFVREGVSRELKGGGLLRNPPPIPKKRR
jgi:hypothetical protein